MIYELQDVHRIWESLNRFFILTVIKCSKAHHEIISKWFYSFIAQMLAVLILYFLSNNHPHPVKDLMLFSLYIRQLESSTMMMENNKKKSADRSIFFHLCIQLSLILWCSGTGLLNRFYFKSINSTIKHIYWKIPPSHQMSLYHHAPFNPDKNCHIMYT